MKATFGGRNALIAIAAIALATGVVLGTGAFLNEIEEDQDVVGVTVELEEPLEDWSLGVNFQMEVNVSNDLSNANYRVHLNLTASCPTGGVATLSGGHMATTGDACSPASQETNAVTLAPGDWQVFVITVKYTGAIGEYEWTITAHEGNP